MIVADAHCDTLTAFPDNIFDSDKAHWSKEKFESVGGKLQYFAIFTMPNITGDSALAFAMNAIGRFMRAKTPDIVHLEKADDYDSSKLNILLSIEGASPIVNDIANLYAFYKAGVRAMTLTWNHRNFLGDGIGEKFGLTSFGKEVVAEMEKIKMIVDVSHLNIAGFDDVARTLKGAFIASHSNVWDLCKHKRNLHKYQIEEIIRRKGFIGINLYSEFLGNKDLDLKKQMVKHIEYILAMGGEDVLGFGADFDGITECPFDNVTAYREIEVMLTEALGGDLRLVEKIMGQNLIDFTLRNL